MANPEHLEILKQGVEVWNRWRKEHPEANIDLSKTNLIRLNLKRVNLQNANLEETNFDKINLMQAYFRDANLRLTNLSNANLRRANLSRTNLSGACLSGTNLVGANLRGADLCEATLRKAILRLADLSGANLIRADLSESIIEWTTFAAVDLRKVSGLDTVEHKGPSTIGADTLYLSGGRVPRCFLQGCGVPEDMITFVASLSKRYIQYYSCFISYSSKDEAFAQRLHADLQQNGVRCWFAPEDMKIGDKIRPAIDKSIRLHDKLLIVLSEHSVNSQWVEQEVETALARERNQEGLVLFPVRLDNTVMEIDSGWPALIKNTRHIGDFSRWKEHDAYQQAFERLLRDLKAEG